MQVAETGEKPTLWHALPANETLARLQTTSCGLDTMQAQERLQTAGPNELQTARGPSLWLLALKQVRSPLVYMLLGAALLSFFAGDPLDVVIILAVVVLNTVVGVGQEWRAERALEALRLLSSPRARVLRNGHATVIPAREVVPGDVIVLEGGDRVAADARVLESIDLHTDESALTGESQPVEKDAGDLPEPTPLADRVNMVWMSTPVTGGRGLAVVVATGMQTSIGEIAREVRGVQREETPLQHRMARLGTVLGAGAISLAVLIFIIGAIRGFPLLEMLLFAVAAAVAAIPEGLPAVISVVLALGVQRMAARNAVIRRLPAVETLGSTTTICTDKTGTLTRNEMTVARIWAGGALFTVTGQGFVPEGQILPENADTPVRAPESGYPGLDTLLALGCLANDATLEQTPDGWQVEGDPTEGALLVVAQKAGRFQEELRERYVRIDEIPFSSKHGYMATLHRVPGENGTVLYVKGAPERMLRFSSHILIDGERIPLTDELRHDMLSINDAFAGDALRVLAGACQDYPDGREDIDRADAEKGLTLVGLWGMLDPPRPEAIRAVREAQGAGIRVKMITGDHATTAAAIARQTGIVTGNEETVTGEELEAMSDDELRQRVEQIAVFARVSPAHKLRILHALGDRGEITAMTGDGVNDAPALKRANIGIAMGVTGTEVAKEAADMVLTDDNFATIVHAIEEGRGIYNNLRRVVFFLITTNLGEILTLAAALFIGLPLPLTAVMILWVNLVTDGVCTIPLGVEPSHSNVLTERPRDPRAGIIDRPMIRRMALLAPLMAVGTLGLFWYELRTGSPEHARTIAFTTLVAYQWFHALNARSRHSSLFQIGPLTNRWLLIGILLAVLLQIAVVYWPPAEVAFRTTALTLTDWALIILVASSIFWIDEVLKLSHIYRR